MLSDKDLRIACINKTLYASAPLELCFLVVCGFARTIMLVSRKFVDTVFYKPFG